jgi:Na+/melibiose symporter-like transporter
MIETIQLSEYDAGLVVLGGQIIDAIFQPLISYCSDNIDTPIGKRMPWYIMGNILVLPCFYMFFNPPDSVIGPDNDNPEPKFMYFMIVPSFMLIGQGAI